MREQINILKYGFMLFLITVGVVSIFNQDTYFINAINSLSIPIFAFSTSIIFVKANYFARNELFQRISNKNKMVDDLSADIEKKENIITNIEQSEKNKIKEQLNLLYEKSLISNKELTFLYKYFFTVDLFTRMFNAVAMLSFTWCLLSLTGILKISANFAWVNIYSLALVFFDFFILDDLLKKSFIKKMDRIQSKAHSKIKKDLANGEEEVL